MTIVVLMFWPLPLLPFPNHCGVIHPTPLHILLNLPVKEIEQIRIVHLKRIVSVLLTKVTSVGSVKKGKYHLK